MDNSPPFHVRLDIKQILEPDTPWLPRSCLEHESSEFRVEDRGGIILGPTFVRINLGKLVLKRTLHLLFSSQELLRLAV